MEPYPIGTPTALPHPLRGFLLEEYKLNQARIAAQEGFRTDIVKYSSTVFFALVAAAGALLQLRTSGGLPSVGASGVPQDQVMPHLLAQPSGPAAAILLIGCAFALACLLMLWRHYVSFSHWARTSRLILEALAGAKWGKHLAYPGQRARSGNVYLWSALLVTVEGSLLLAGAMLCFGAHPATAVSIGILVCLAAGLIVACSLRAHGHAADVRLKQAMEALIGPCGDTRTASETGG